MPYCLSSVSLSLQDVIMKVMLRVKLFNFAGTFSCDFGLKHTLRVLLQFVHVMDAVKGQ